jgi:hypothetical protein
MKWMPIAFVGFAVAGFLYSMINPAAIKKNSEIHYKALGFPEQPIWFWRLLAAIGFIGALITLLKITLWKSN